MFEVEGVAEPQLLAVVAELLGIVNRSSEGCLGDALELCQLTWGRIRKYGTFATRGHRVTEASVAFASMVHRPTARLRSNETAG